MVGGQCYVLFYLFKCIVLILLPSLGNVIDFGQTKMEVFPFVLL